MELEEFIKNTLINIAHGLGHANLELAKAEGKTIGVDTTPKFMMNPTWGSREGNLISFDVAVTVSHENNKTGGGGIRIAVASLGGAIENASTQQHMSRIKFSMIPSGPIG